MPKRIEDARRRCARDSWMSKKRDDRKRREEESRRKERDKKSSWDSRRKREGVNGKRLREEGNAKQSTRIFHSKTLKKFLKIGRLKDRRPWGSSMRLRRERSANGPSCNKSNNCGNNSNTLPSNRLLKRPLMYVECLPFCCWKWFLPNDTIELLDATTDRSPTSGDVSNCHNYHHRHHFPDRRHPQALFNGYSTLASRQLG